MYDLITIIKKEVWEIRHSGRNLLWIFALLAIPLLISYGNTERSIVPAQVLYLLLPSFISLSLGAQIMMDSILGEKKAKTLELLLSTKIPPIKIFFGKIVPAVIAGYMIALISILGIQLLPFNLDIRANGFILFVLPLIVTYIAVSVSAITTIIIPDEKTAPMITMVVIIIPLIIVANQSLSQLGWFFLIAGALLISSILTWLGSVVIIKHPMITKI